MPFHMLAKGGLQLWRWAGWSRPAEEPVQQQWLVGLPLVLLRQSSLDDALRDWLTRLEMQLFSSGATLILHTAAGLHKVGREGLCTRHESCPWVAEADRCPDVGRLNTCIQCLRVGRHRVVCGVNDGHGSVGILMLEFPRPPRPHQKRQLSEVAQVLSETLALVLDERQRRQRDLAAERALLSRELHDSVAQELSYLQIRVSRMASVLDNPERPGEAAEMLQDLKSNLQRANRQVRELISLTRLTMDGRCLNEAIRASVDEFSRRSSCVFELDNRISEQRMGAETELQVLHIIREALANVVRHSHARQVLVCLKELRDRGVEVCIEDDGIGLPAAADLSGHYGLQMMQERARSISACLTVEPRHPKGTRVCLIWRDR